VWAKPGADYCAGLCSWRGEVSVRAAIREEPATADAGLGEDACRPVILPVQLAREKIPVNFLLFTGKPGFAPSQVVPPYRAWPPQRVPLAAPTSGDCGRHLLAAVLVELRWLNCATIFAVLRKRMRGTSPGTSPGQRGLRRPCWWVSGVMRARVTYSTARGYRFRAHLNLSAVIAGLDQAIHLLTKTDGCAGQARA